MNSESHHWNSCLYNKDWLEGKNRQEGCKVFKGRQLPLEPREGDIWWLDSAVLVLKGQDWVLDGFVDE